MILATIFNSQRELGGVLTACPITPLHKARNTCLLRSMLLSVIQFDIHSENSSQAL